MTNYSTQDIIRASNSHYGINPKEPVMYEIKTIYKDSDGTLHEETTTHATKDSYTNRIELIRSWYNTNMVAGYIGREIKVLDKEGVIL